MLKIMIKFKIKFEIIFVKLKLKSKQIQETTAFSFIGNQELRQSLEASASGYNNLADDPDLNPYGSEAFLQSIADATELRSHAEDRIATQLAMDESTQDSSNPIACVHFVNENETKHDNENENEFRRLTMLFLHRCPLSNVCRWLCTTLRKHSLCLAKSQWRGLIQNTMQVSSKTLSASSCERSMPTWTCQSISCAQFVYMSSTSQWWQAMVARMSMLQSVGSLPTSKDLQEDEDPQANHSRTSS